MAYRKFEEVKEEFNKLIEETAGEIGGEGAGRFKAASVTSRHYSLT
jgi:hypothetical protein